MICRSRHIRWGSSVPLCVAQWSANGNKVSGSYRRIRLISVLLISCGGVYSCVHSFDPTIGHATRATDAPIAGLPESSKNITYYLPGACGPEMAYDMLCCDPLLLRLSLAPICYPFRRFSRTELSRFRSIAEGRNRAGHKPFIVRPTNRPEHKWNDQNGL